MNNREFINRIESNPIIAAVKDDEGLKIALTEDIGIIFVLYGDICTISGIVKKIKEADKVALVHVDLITGLNTTKDVCLDFIKNNTKEEYFEKYGGKYQAFKEKYNEFDDGKASKRVINLLN
jgi:glycerol uptake operon antiterminator